MIVLVWYLWALKWDYRLAKIRRYTSTCVPALILRGILYVLRHRVDEQLAVLPHRRADSENNKSANKSKSLDDRMSSSDGERRFVQSSVLGSQEVFASAIPSSPAKGLF